MKMIQNIKNSRLFMMIALCMMAVAVSAQVTVSMSPIEINPGETQTVSISVKSDEAIGYSWQGDIYLPEGLSIVKQDGVYVTKNADRCRVSHGLTSVTKAENSGLAERQIRFSLLNPSGLTLKGTEGEVLTFCVKASESLGPTTTIELKDSKIDGTYDADCKATVTNLSNPEIKVLSLTAKDVELKAGGTGIVDFDFSTNYAMSGVQASIVLPKGVTPVKDAEGLYATFNSEMLSNNHTYAASWDEASNTVTVLTYSGDRPTQNLAKNEGRLFSIRVNVEASLMGEQTVYINDVFASTKAGVKYDIKSSTFKMNVTESAPMEGALSADDCNVKAGAEKVIDFNFTSRSELSGFQASVKLPEGITPIKDQDDEWATFNLDRLTATHTSSSSYDEATNTITVLTYSSEADIKDEEGQIFSIKVNVPQTLASGAYAADIYDAFASTKSGNKYDIPTYTFKIVVDNVHTITFDTDGGSEVAPISQEYNSEVTAPAEPTKEGYTFIGWEPTVPAMMPFEDMTVKAQWQVNSYRLTYIVDDETIKDTLVNYGDETPRVEAPERIGYTFIWTEIPETMPAHDVVVYGTFIKIVGDVNEDGRVNGTDQQIIVDLIMDRSNEVIDNLTELQRRSADLNSDDRYDVADYVMITNLIIYGNLYGQQVSNARGKVEYAAMQMDINVPEGSKIVYTASSSDVKVVTNTLANGECRMMIYSTDCQAVDMNELLSTVTVGGQTLGNVEIDNIIAATPQGESVSLSSLPLATGINSVAGTSVENSSIYSISGASSRTLNKGINIVKGTDGCVRKVLVK